MKIKMTPLADIQPYAQNPRLNDKAVEAVAESIKQYGFRQPIVVDAEGVIVVGHTRYKAATELGLAKVPVHVAEDLTTEQARAYRLADNRTAEMAEWDLDLLPLELHGLLDAGIDLTTLGFDDRELHRLLDPDPSDGLTDPDSVPSAPDEAITQPGDLWILGDHRLLCGDSSLEADVDRLVEGKPVQLVNTDPPYNVNVEPRSNNAIAAGLSSFPAIATNATHEKLRPKDRPLINDCVSEDEFERLLGAWFGNMARVLEPGRGFYIWGGYLNCANYPPVLKATGLYFSQAVIWNKLHPVLGRKDFMGAHEWCFYGWREGKAHVYLGPHNASDLWEVKKVSAQNMTHLTEKPVELAERAMAYSSREGERVLDLFGGSGSTLIAAERTGRKALLMELDPLYCDVITSRWEQFTGRKAERQEGKR